MEFKMYHLKNNYSCKFSNSINHVLSDWNSVKHHNLYLTLPYLQAIENSSINLIDYIYVVVYDANRVPVGILYLQRKKIDSEVFSQEKFPNEISKIIALKFSNRIIDHLLVLGSLLTTGVNGFVFSSKVSECDVNNIINDVTLILKEEYPYDVLLIKEFYTHQHEKLQSKIKQKFIPLSIDVNMEVKIMNDWRNFDDYLQSMTTKYRTRAKNVYKKTSNILVKELTTQEIKKYSIKIKELYQSVLKTAKFNMIVLTEKSFYELKKTLKQKFIFRGYFVGDEMVAFSTACINNNILDANYVGVDYSVNKTTPLYQRILYDYVQLAINLNAFELKLGRTAELIKSSIGAKPVVMDLYIQHQNKIINKIMGPFVKKIEPTRFEVRNPYKKGIE